MSAQRRHRKTSQSLSGTTSSQGSAVRERVASPERDIERAVNLQQRAWALQAAGKLDSASQVYRTALRLIVKTIGPRSADAANLLNDLADLHCERAAFRQALVYAKRASRIPAPRQVCRRTHELLGTLFRITGRYAAAERHFRRALTMSRSAAESACVRNNLGVLYKYMGRYEEGLKLYHRAMKTLTALYGQNSVEAGTIYHNLGGILHAQGDFCGAKAPGRKAWDISRRRLGENHPATMLDAAAYAGILVGLGRYQEAQNIYLRALVIFRRVYGPQHYEIAATLHGLGAVMAGLGKLTSAKRYYRRALVIKTRLLGARHPDTVLTREGLVLLG